MGRDIVVTGLHRSGTSFVGDVLSWAGLFQIFEPMNRQFGSVLVDRWKPHPETETADGVSYGRVLERVLHERIRFKPTLQTRSPLARLAGRALGMHRQALSYELGRMANRLQRRRRLFKDPDMLFFADELQREHDCDVVVLVRHPCAFYASVKRLGWRFPLDTLLEQEALVARHLSPYAEHLTRRPRSFPEEAALLWLFAYKVVHDFAQENCALNIVRHEDLCERPLATFRSLFSRLELEFGAGVERSLRAATEGTRAAARDNRAHDRVRDSRALAWSWTQTLADEEIKQILDLTAPLIGRFYPD